jgi:hypothetical protein
MGFLASTIETEAYRVIDQATPWLTGIDATHDNFQGVLGEPYFVDTSSVAHHLATTTSAAPFDATYITQTPNGTLSNEQALSTLTTGILKSTTGTGVLSIATGADLPSVLTTKGDVSTFSTVPARLGIGSNRSVFIADSAQATGNRWGNDPILNGAAIDNSIIGGSTPAAATFTVVKLTGTAGAGFFEDIAQSSAPAAPASGFRLYAGSSHQFRWIGQGGFVTTLDTTGITADRVYTFPNLTDNVLTDTSTSTLTNKTHTAPIITGGSGFRPTADSTTAINFYKADGTTPVIQIDTTDSFVSIGPAAGTPTKLLDLYYGDVKFNQITAPGACTAALNGLGGSVDAGTHIYKVTFVTAVGETSLGTASNTVTNDASNTQNNLTAIPTGTAGQGVTSRKVYRTKAGGAQYFLLATIANNTTTTLADTTADASLGAVDFTNRNNTTTANLWIGASKVGVLTTGNILGIGNNVFNAITGGLNLVAFGNGALQAATTATNDVAVGGSALLGLTTGSNGVGAGFDVGLSVTQASRFVLIGSQAGWTSGSTPSSANALTTGNDNTFIGFQAGQESATQRSFAIAIGSGASVDASNTCIIGGTTTTNAVSVGVGRTTVNAALHFTKLDAGTNAVLNVGILDHKTSGTPAANYGTGFLLTGQSSTTVDRELVRLRGFWVTATDASRAARGMLSAWDTAERDCFSWEASGTVAKIGHYGATPVVQPATTGTTTGFTAGAGTAVRDDSTFTGGTGATAYRISDVVLALKQLGLLAA